MKKIFLIYLLSYFASQNIIGQTKKVNTFSCSYGESNNAIELCNYFNSKAIELDKFAEKAVDRILKPIGLPRNFVLVSCPNIQNALAVTPSDGIRYIVYDVDFMKAIDNSTSPWSSLSILAHEIGHHLNGHTLTESKDLVEQRKRELEADEFSGFVMYKLGATLKESQAAMLTVSNNNDDTNSDHPTLNKRLAAIEKGYNNAKALQPIANVKRKPSAETYFNEGAKLYFEKNYKVAIDKFNAAIAINNKFVDAYFYRAASKERMKNIQGAIADYNKTLELDPNAETAYVLIAYIKKDLKNYEEAMSYVNKALLIAPNSNWTAYFIRGEIYYDLKDFEKAILDFDKSIQIDPNQGMTYWDRGMAKMELQVAKKAFDVNSGMCADFKKACDLDISKACDYSARFCNKK